MWTTFEVYLRLITSGRDVSRLLWLQCLETSLKTKKDVALEHTVELGATCMTRRPTDPVEAQWRSLLADSMAPAITI